MSYIIGYVSGGFIGEVVLKTSWQNQQLIRSLFIALLNVVFLRLFLKVTLFKRVRNWKMTAIIFLTSVIFTLIVNHEDLFQRFNLVDILRVRIGAGISEEILFRVVIMSVLLLLFQNSKRSFLWSSLISSILFALAHYTNVSSGQDVL